MFSFIPSSSACSIAGCSPNETEVLSSFTIRVRHRDKPLAGVNFHISRNGEEKFSGVTDETGSVYVESHGTREYQLSGDLLNVVYTCFHINGGLPEAKSKLGYT